MGRTSQIVFNLWLNPKGPWINIKFQIYFLPEASFGLRVLSLPASVSVSLYPCVCISARHPRAINHYPPFKLGSPNFTAAKHLRSIFSTVWGWGGVGCDWLQFRVYPCHSFVTAAWSGQPRVFRRLTPLLLYMCLTGDLGVHHKSLLPTAGQMMQQ